ncbi:chemotaxis protein [Kiloniella spongiae]|uniref:Chemotaxis protein n=1 Tax=Kiloniella spongiae TaxID=1489064 RepID=A0A0H2MRR9_9PROT|nr:PAS domain-containing protein [Kiloniella spongiae]KLN59390.1 chemotaxis protein [Kiloniella spongiae]
MDQNTRITGTERFFDKDDIIVSKTDTSGKLTYVNDTFLDIADYTEQEVIGKPHNVIRHPNMPRCIFKTLWDTISSGEEIFAYVVNKTKHGDYYWVLAHVTPSFGKNGNIIGYHSNRRSPKLETITNIIAPLYAELIKIEENNTRKKDGIEASSIRLNQIINDSQMDLNEYFLSL